MGESMEKFVYHTTELETEREKYRRDLTILEGTEGWQLLTDRQRQIIQTTLYLQNRSERDMDPVHKNDPWYFDWFKKTKYIPQYQASLGHVKRWYCHAAIASLENGSLTGIRPPKHPIAFFDASYLKISDIKELKTALESTQFPAVTHVSLEPANIKGEDPVYHSFLSLGHDSNHDIVVWDKEGFGFPYRVTTLKTIYDEYCSFSYWGIRKLR